MGGRLSDGMPDVEAMSALLTTVEAARAVNVSAHAVRKWRTRGWLGLDGARKHLANYGTDAEPRHRYRDVLDAEMETRNSGKSFRGRGDWAARNQN